MVVLPAPSARLQPFRFSGIAVVLSTSIHSALLSESGLLGSYITSVISTWPAIGAIAVASHMLVAVLQLSPRPVQVPQSSVPMQPSSKLPQLVVLQLSGMHSQVF